MLTKDEFIAMARTAGLFYYDLSDVDGEDLGDNLESDKGGAVNKLVLALSGLIEDARNEARAAARAEVEPLVRQILEALENTSDLVFKDVRLSHTRNLALQLGRAWLAEKPQEAPHATPS